MKLQQDRTAVETESRGASHPESADWSLRREILRTLVDRVVIEHEQIRVVYRINFPFFAKRASDAGEGEVLHFCWRGGLAISGVN